MRNGTKRAGLICVDEQVNLIAILLELPTTLAYSISCRTVKLREANA